MKTRIYWARQYTFKAVRGCRFTCSCWWLNQRVKFLKWQLGVDDTGTTCTGIVIAEAGTS